MKLSKVESALKNHGIKYDLAGDPKVWGERNTIRAYCYAYSDDYDTLRVTEHGDVEINGQIDDLKSWLGY